MRGTLLLRRSEMHHSVGKGTLARRILEEWCPQVKEQPSYAVSQAAMARSTGQVSAGKPVEC